MPPLTLRQSILPYIPSLTKVPNGWDPAIFSSVPSVSHLIQGNRSATPPCGHCNPKLNDSLSEAARVLRAVGNRKTNA